MIGSRVSLFVDLSQSGRADVRIDLGGNEALMSQEFLHASNVRPSVQQMGREAVPKCMRRGS